MGKQFRTETIYWKGHNSDFRFFRSGKMSCISAASRSLSKLNHFQLFFFCLRKRKLKLVIMIWYCYGNEIVFASTKKKLVFMSFRLQLKITYSEIYCWIVVRELSWETYWNCVFANKEQIAKRAKKITSRNSMRNAIQFTFNRQLLVSVNSGLIGWKYIGRTIFFSSFVSYATLHRYFGDSFHLLLIKSTSFACQFSIVCAVAIAVK